MDEILKVLELEAEKVSKLIVNELTKKIANESLSQQEATFTKEENKQNEKIIKNKNKFFNGYEPRFYFVDSNVDLTKGKTLAETLKEITNKNAIKSYYDKLKYKPIEKEQQPIHKIKIEPIKSLQGLDITYEGNEEEMGNYTIQFNNNCIYLKTKDGKYTISLTDKQVENIYKILTDLDCENSVDEYLKAIALKRYWSIQANNKDYEQNELICKLDKVNQQIRALNIKQEELLNTNKRIAKEKANYEENNIFYEVDIEDIESSLE